MDGCWAITLESRADADEASRMIESLVAQESDRRVAIWLRVRLGGERMTNVAAIMAIATAAVSTASSSVWRKRPKTIQISRVD